MARKPIVAGNWKMNKTVPEAIAFVRELMPLVREIDAVEVVICPPFTALYTVHEELEALKTGVALGAQNIFWKEKGAYTSQISPAMLIDAGVKYVIIGHSEPRGRFGTPEEGANEDVRRYFGESDYTVNLKVKAALAHGLYPIVCCGELLDERKADRTDLVIQGQLRKGLSGVSRDDAASKLVIAYEPVWAIGTGETCDTPEANRVCGMIRAEIATLYNEGVAQAIRIQYGGSMKPSNAGELLATENIDGGLIGGASLVPADFAAIVKAGIN